MADVLDFSKHRPPTLPVVFNDKAQTSISVTPPSVDLVEELIANADTLQQLLLQDDDSAVEQLYDLAARLMSCNRNLKKITPESLRKTYKIEEADLAEFFTAYTDYLHELKNAKN